MNWEENRRASLREWRPETVRMIAFGYFGEDYVNNHFNESHGYIDKTDAETVIDSIVTYEFENGQELAPDAAEPDVITVVADDGTQVRKFVSEEPYRTESGRYIMEVLFPTWAERFLRKNADYGDQHRFALGPRAEYVGIDRKMYKLEEAIWHEEELNGEQVDEILDDLIGQAFILKDLLAGNWEPRSRRDRKSP